MTATIQRFPSVRLKAAPFFGAAAMLWWLLSWASVSAVGEESGWTLERALAHVARENPDARMARARLDLANARLAGARAALMPGLSAEAGYGVTNNGPGVFLSLLNQRQLSFDQDFNNPDVTDNLSGELRLDYALYTGGAREAAIRAGKFGVAAANQESLATRRQLELEVARAFFQIRQAAELTEVAEAGLASLRASREVAAKRVAQQTALETAVLDIEVKIAEAETDVVIAENMREVRLAHLGILLGLEQPESLRVTGAATTLPVPGGGTSGERPDLEAAAQRRLQAEQGTEMARAGNRPAVHAFASTRRDEGIRESGGGGSWAAGISVRLNIWDGGKTRAEIAEAKAREVEAAEEERKRRLGIAFEVSKARLDFGAAGKRITQAEKAIEQATRSRDITRARFAEGLALTTELIDSERALTQARAMLSQARAEEQIAIAHWRHALGLNISSDRQHEAP